MHIYPIRMDGICVGKAPVINHMNVRSERVDTPWRDRIGIDRIPTCALDWWKSWSITDPHVDT